MLAEKDGYFKAYRSFRATSGTNQVNIKLLKKTLTGSIEAAAGGIVTLTNGAKISLLANSIVNRSNTVAYTGTVNIYAAYIDPSATDIAQTLPGSFMADDINNKRVTLASYGMLAVELESSGGERLQLKPGAAATLTTPIPASLQSTAPASIAMWYLDEQSGLWKQEGSARKTGANYVGDVSHFSFWNCDRPFSAVTLSLTLQTSKGLPLINTQVRLSAAAVDTFAASMAYGTTDSLGQVSGLVPANTPLVLDVLDNCNKSIYTKNITALNQNTDLGKVTVTNGSSSIITIQGMLLNCNGKAVTRGYAIINLDNMVAYAAVDDNGHFEAATLLCSANTGNYDLIGVDENVNQQGQKISGKIIIPVTDINNVPACGISSLEYIQYTVDGVEHAITGKSGYDSSLIAYNFPQPNTMLLTTAVFGWNETDYSSIEFRFTSPAQAGSYSMDTLFVTAVNGGILVKPFNITITNFPQSAGEFYEGNFSGNFTGDRNKLHSITCTFRVRTRR